MIAQLAHCTTTEDQKALRDVIELVEHVSAEEVRGMYCSSTGMARHDVEIAVQVQIAQGNEALRKLFPELSGLNA